MDSGGGCDEMPALIRRHFALLQHQILFKKKACISYCPLWVQLAIAAHTLHF
jgi:hypothetical protein